MHVHDIICSGYSVSCPVVAFKCVQTSRQLPASKTPKRRLGQVCSYTRLACIIPTPCLKSVYCSGALLCHANPKTQLHRLSVPFVCMCNLPATTGRSDWATPEHVLSPGLRCTGSRVNGCQLVVAGMNQKPRSTIKERCVLLPDLVLLVDESLLNLIGIIFLLPPTHGRC